MEKFLNKLKNKESLNFEESKSAFESMMSGKVKEEDIYDFLTLSSAKGETSAAAALLLSSFGVKVAKHGNKSVSSKCGSADVLEKLNININLGPKEVEASINDKNFGFMFAPGYHSAMKYVGPVRKKIGKRTIFNLIGPLSSPAKVKRQVVGVFDKKLLSIFAQSLKNLNIKKALIVNSEDGLDEISPYANTSVVELSNGRIREFVLNPNDLNIKVNDFNHIIG